MGIMDRYRRNNEVFDSGAVEPMKTPQDVVNRAVMRSIEQLEDYKAKVAARDAEDNYKLKKIEEERNLFLELSGALSASPKLYALWLYSYIAQGGSVDMMHERKFPQSKVSKGESFEEDSLSSIDRDGAKFERRTTEFYDQRGLFWVPTNNEAAHRIPAGYGSLRLDIIYLPDLAKLDTAPTSESRQFGKYGHSRLFTLKLDEESPTGLRATANGTDGRADIYPDVGDLMVGLSGDFDPDALRDEIKELRKIGLAGLNSFVQH